MRKVCVLLFIANVMWAMTLQATSGHTVGYLQPAVVHVSENSVPMIFYRDLFRNIRSMPKTAITLTFVNGTWRTEGDDNSTVEYKIANPTKAEVAFEVVENELLNVVFVFNNPIQITPSGTPTVSENRLEFSRGQDTGTVVELTPNLGQAVGRHLNISSDPLNLFLGIPFVFSKNSFYLGVSGGSPPVRKSMISAVEYKKNEALPNEPGTKVQYDKTSFHFSPQLNGPGNVPSFSSYADALAGSWAVLSETTFKLDVDSCRDQTDACNYQATFVGGKLEELNLGLASGRLSGDGILLQLGDNSTFTFKNPDPPPNQPRSFEPRVIFNSNDSAGLLTADRGLYNGGLLNGTRLPFKDGSVFNVTDQFRGSDPSSANLEGLHFVASGEKLTELAFGSNSTSLNLGLGEGSKLEAGGAGTIQIRRGSVIADITEGRWTFAGSEDVKQSRLRDLELELAGGHMNISNGTRIKMVSGSTLSAAQLRIDTDLEPNVTGPFGRSTLLVQSDQNDQPIQFSEALQVFPKGPARVIFDEAATPMRLEVNRRFLTGGYRFTADLSKLIFRQEKNTGGSARTIKFSLEQGTVDFSFNSNGSSETIEGRRLVITDGMVKETGLSLGEVGDLTGTDGLASFNLTGTLRPGASSALTGGITWTNVSSVRGRIRLNPQTMAAFAQGRFDRADLELRDNAADPIIGTFRNVQLSLADLSSINIPGLIRIKTTGGNVLTANVADDPLAITAERSFVKGSYTVRLGFSEISAVNSSAMIQGGQNQGSAVLSFTNRSNGDIVGRDIAIEGIRRLKGSNGAMVPLTVKISRGEAAVPQSGPVTFHSDLELRAQPSPLGAMLLADYRPIPTSNPKGWFFPGMLQLSVADFHYSGRMQLSGSGLSIAGANAALKLSFSSPPDSLENNLRYGEYKEPKKLKEGVKDNEFRGMVELWRNKTKITDHFDCRQRVHLGKGIQFLFDTRPLVSMNNDAVTLTFNERSVDISQTPQVVLYNCPGNQNPALVQNVPARMFSDALSGHRFFPALSAPPNAISPLQLLVWTYASVHVVAALDSSEQKVTFRLVP